MLRRIVLILLLALIPALLFAQATSGADQLREGLLQFKQGQYQEAIRAFRRLIFDTEDEQLNTADAYYWISRAYLAINNYDEAARNLEYFLTHFSSHSYYPDALYQKGRLLYLQGDFENAIQVLERFISDYPDSEYIGSAFFWVGESLFALGHLEEAARMFNKVIGEYPHSVKSEACRYRLSLIEYKKREDEILRLLKWSHEEALKSVEEFRRREKTYEQAIAVYQKKLSSASAGAALDGDKVSSDQLRLENEALKNKIRSLEAQLAQDASEASAEAAAQQLSALENREQALQIKADALAVKEALLRAMAEESE